MALFRRATGPKVGRTERAFLPAALEIVETPPAPLARATALSICAVILVAIVWASIGQVDIISIATGKIVAPSHTQVVQPLSTGSIKAILVAAGQSVRAGQPLIVLDDTNAQAEFSKAKADLDSARLDQARLTGALNPAGPDPFASLTDLSSGAVEQARLRLDSQRATLTAKLASLDQQQQGKQADLQTARESAAKDDLLLPLVQQVADIRSKASQMQYGDYLELADAQQQLIATQSDRRLQDLHIAGATAAIAELDQERQQAQAEFSEQAYVDLARAKSEADAARATLSQAQYALDRLVLHSPLDGAVTEVNVHTVGAVVTPGEQLVSIVSDNDPIAIEAVLPNEEVGFVRSGQTVDVKVDAYPFTRYGLLKGTVQDVAQDAEALTQNQGTATGPQLASDQAQTIEGSQRLVYRVVVSLGGNPLLVDGKPAQLIPGMAVTAEIKTGQRTVLDFLLSPLSAFAHDGLRER
jgi:hemolysin D